MMGNEHSNLLTTIRSALRMDARIGADRHKISLCYENGTLIMEGEVEELAAKKLALEAAAAFPEVAHIADRLRVVPATVMGDGVVTLSGDVPSFRRKRLAGAIA